MTAPNPTNPGVCAVRIYIVAWNGTPMRWSEADGRFFVPGGELNAATGFTTRRAANRRIARSVGSRTNDDGKKDDAARYRVLRVEVAP